MKAYPMSVAVDLEILDFASGDVIFKEGDETDSAYILLSGSVLLTKHAHMRLHVVEIVRDGFFGLLPIIDGKPRHYTATAREQTTCSKIPKEVFLRTFNASDPIIRAAMRDLSTSLRQASERLIAGGILNVEDGDTR